MNLEAITHLWNYRPRKFRSDAFLFWSRGPDSYRKNDRKRAVVWPWLVLQLSTVLALTQLGIRQSDWRRAGIRSTNLHIVVECMLNHAMSLAQSEPEPRFKINISSYQHKKSHCGDKSVVRSSYLHNGISYTGKMSSLYWIGALDAYRARINTNQCSKDNSFTETTCIYLIYGHNDISGIRNYLFDKIIYFKKEVKRNYPHALFKVIAMWIVLTIFVNPAWMSNHIHYDEWHEITYPFQMSTVRSLEFGNWYVISS